MSEHQVSDSIKRPPGVPEGARPATLAELRDEIAKESGSLRLGPRGSYLRFQMRMFPWVLMGTARAILGGGVSAIHGERVFALEYSDGRRKPGNWKLAAFTHPQAAERQLWIWTLDDERAERDLRRRRAARVEHERAS